VKGSGDWARARAREERRGRRRVVVGAMVCDEDSLPTLWRGWCLVREFTVLEQGLYDSNRRRESMREHFAGHYVISSLYNHARVAGSVR
jgi:hypothetical protein